MKTTLELPDQLLISAKKRAAERRKPLKALVEQGLRWVLSAKEATRSKKKNGRKTMGIIRLTYVINENGKIEKIYRNLKVDGHAEKILEYFSE